MASAANSYYELYRGSRYSPATTLLTTKTLTVMLPHSIGMSLIDTLDDLVHSGRIEPQTAMKVIATFDKSITEVLADKVKARMNFKVSSACCFCFLCVGWGIIG